MANADATAASAAAEPAPAAAASFAFLWLVWAGLLAAAMLVGNLEGHAAPWPTALRMGSSLVLVVTAWWAYASWRAAAIGPFALAIAVGMTLGAIGDFFNAGLLGFLPLADPTLGGIAAFGLGHIAYITGCLRFARPAGLTNRRTMIVSVAVWQLIALVGWYAIVMLGTERRELVWPALPYSLLLAGTAGITAGLALQQARLFPLALGAALFLASDLILAFELFRGPFAYDTECVWLTYGPGQMLIVFSILSAAAVLRDARPRAGR